MKKKIHLIGFIFCSLLLMAGGAYYYLDTRYFPVTTEVSSISIVLNKPYHYSSPTAYLMDDGAAIFTYDKPIASTLVNDSTLLFDFVTPKKVRQFRIYFSPSDAMIALQAIHIESSHVTSIDLKRFSLKKLDLVSKQKSNLSFRVVGASGNSFLESPRLLYLEDYPTIFISLTIAVILLISACLYGSRLVRTFTFRWPSLQELSIVAVIVSIFLPQRFFNIALVFCFLLHVRNFDLKRFASVKLNYAFVILFVIIASNFLLLSTRLSLRPVEKHTLLLAMPIFLSCLRTRYVPLFLTLSAIIISAALILGSVVDIAVFRNLEILSFTNFTGAIHPVYYSYLIAFGILFIQIKVEHTGKYVIQVFLFAVLILCGSKLITIATLVIIAFLFNKRLSIIFIPVLVLGLFLFPPMKNRILSIVDLNDLSVIHEKHVKDPNDPRLNGFTIRMIVWQESLHVPNAKVFLFGRGAGLTGDEFFKEKLRERGLLSHLHYNSHNQYLTAFFETGFVGLLMLIILLVAVIRTALIRNDVLLLSYTSLMSLAFLSESVLEKSSGTALFCITILGVVNAWNYSEGRGEDHRYNQTPARTNDNTA